MSPPQQKTSAPQMKRPLIAPSRRPSPLHSSLFGDKWRYGKNKTEDKGKGKAAANVDDDESFDEDDEKEFRESLDSLFDEKTGRWKESDGIAATGSSSQFNKFSAIYDTGASHHFIPTKDLTLGLEGIDTSELKTSEICHLSKAQRFVSREPWPTRNHPLDEVFIDTVGKLVPSTDNMQYATNITDAKTRMRWVLTTTTKDQIAPTLVKWVQSLHHQYDKRVRTIFRDGGSEFIKIKQFCEQQGIRTDTSAPYTTEQNGPSEAANKVILRVARLMLIDASIPPCYWSWGKFEPRADKGWFLGFQQNISKKFLILHSHITLVQGLKWAVSFTPHASFNEDIIFGDEMNPIDKQRTTSYWTNDTLATSFPTAQPNEPILTADLNNQNPSTPNDDIPQSSGKTQSSSHPNDFSNTTDPIILDSISHTQSSQSSNHQQDSNTQHPQTPPIPSSTWIESNPSPLSSVNTEPDTIETPEHYEIHTPHQTYENIISPTEDENEVRYDQVMTGWDSISQTAGQKRAHSPDSNPINKNNGNDIAIRNNYEDSDNDTEIEQSQTTPHSDDLPADDLIVTGWYPMRSLAGQKRAHMPEEELMRTKRGRAVKRIDYHDYITEKLHLSQTIRKPGKRLCQVQNLTYGKLLH
ncbi:hypothetical protein K3495_g2930 [Podosphaera aphanis]|nr:hypothetical protein K3495_g2930 [Podosphaera aphanis]